jgi:outer membrane protein insertion porin family
MGYRLGLGVDLFAKLTQPSSYVSYSSETYGGAVRLGMGLTENLSLQLRYSAYSQKITLGNEFSFWTDCNNTLPNPARNWPACFANGEASLPVKISLGQGARLTSLIGYSLVYNTLDNNKNPTSGILGEFRQDFAGVGGDVNFIRTTADARYYRELLSDLVGVIRVQGGHMTSWGGQTLNMLDHFQMGPNLVRGFAPSGFGPRDLTGPSFGYPVGTGIADSALGGTLYWGASF